MKITAAALANMINATIEGDPEAVITTPAKIEEAGPGSITFLANPAYEHFLYASQATAVLVSRDFQPKSPSALNSPNRSGRYARRRRRSGASMRRRHPLRTGIRTFARPR